MSSVWRASPPLTKRKCAASAGNWPNVGSTAVAFCAPAEMGELQAVEKLLKKPIPVLGGAPWSAEMVAAAPKAGQNRGQRPGGGRGGQKSGSKPPAQGQRPAGQKPRSGGAPKPQGGSFAPRRADGTGGAKRRPV